MPHAKNNLQESKQELKYLRDKWLQTEHEPYPEEVVDRIDRNKYQSWLLTQIQILSSYIKKEEA